ncbi:hypothetical protein V495_01938 [Pseudogymnoascus sp. VKM F-4514 (FW-929)]|nr:hypothetical protein V495_01938 [Pseudogymnoascus sp. VKM F-4514 (FW-929)]KFY56721.1 hypothetical protein V497_06058 [Pseudogymnoascus sp. VKM F-4516 (FW-969)]
MDIVENTQGGNNSLDSDASDINFINDIEAMLANKGSNSDLRTALGGAQIIRALDIAIGAQEATREGKDNPPRSQLPEDEAIGDTEIFQDGKCKNGGFGADSQVGDLLAWDKQDTQELRLWKKKTRTERLQKLQDQKYCTQACLLGLKRGSRLDEDCPNAASHRASEGSTYHHIDAETFTRQVQEQISEFYDRGCTYARKSGSTGALFKLLLFRYGYTFVGKGVVEEHIVNLRHEAEVYEQRLDSLQDEAVPVYLGNIDIVEPYIILSDFYHERFVAHMMLMSWSGDEISKSDVPVSEVNRSLQEVVRRGVIHNDIFKENDDWASVRSDASWWTTDKIRHLKLSQMRKDVCYPNVRRRNMLWNSERKRVMLIDFERSVLLDAELDEPAQTERLEKIEDPEKLDQPDNLEEMELPEKLDQPELSDLQDQSSRKRKSDTQEELPCKNTKVDNANVQGCNFRQ